MGGAGSARADTPDVKSNVTSKSRDIGRMVYNRRWRERGTRVRALLLTCAGYVRAAEGMQTAEMDDFGVYAVLGANSPPHRLLRCVLRSLRSRLLTAFALKQDATGRVLHI